MPGRQKRGKLVSKAQGDLPLTKRQGSRLHFLWIRSHHRMALDPAWVKRVLSIEVDLKPAARAVLREPGKPFTVEVQFLSDPQWRGPGISGIHVIPDEPMDDGELADVDLDLIAYLAALELRWERGPQGDHYPAPTRRPEPGKPVGTAFYRSLLRDYDRLLKAGHRDPAKELADVYGEKHSTVKSWLSRGRRYLAGQEEDR